MRHERLSFRRPYGTENVFVRAYPALEVLGYCRMSLRDAKFSIFTTPIVLVVEAVSSQHAPKYV